MNCCASDIGRRSLSENGNKKEPAGNRPFSTFSLRGVYEDVYSESVMPTGLLVRKEKFRSKGKKDLIEEYRSMVRRGEKNFPHARKKPRPNNSGSRDSGSREGKTIVREGDPREKRHPMSYLFPKKERKLHLREGH